jgi:mRNA-degrading endonuclease toxin of MazEF toxin-antitoxin module
VSAPVCGRGDIWMLDGCPGRGSEPGGFRPAVIVQCDEGNHAPGARTTILVPLTSQGRAYSFYVPVPAGAMTGLKVDSWANCTRVFTVAKDRLRTRLGVAPSAALEAIARALADTLGLPPDMAL